MSKSIDINDYRASRNTKGNYSVSTLSFSSPKKLAGEEVGAYDSTKEMYTIIKDQIHKLANSYGQEFTSYFMGYEGKTQNVLYIELDTKFLDKGNSSWIEIYRIYTNNDAERNQLSAEIFEYLKTFNVKGVETIYS